MASIIRHASALALIACVALMAPAAAIAQEGDPAAQLSRGLAAFQDLEYQTAIDALRPLLKSDAASRAQRLEALELIGISHLILGDEKAAASAFRSLLEVEPAHRLRHHDGSPKIRSLFERLRKEIAPDVFVGPVDLQHAPPDEAIAGSDFEVEASAAEGADQAKSVILFWRQDDKLAYAEQPLREQADGRWRTSLPLPAAERDYAVEYYIEARGLAGAPVGRVGGPERPLRLPVAGESSAGSPWYTRWYVWAGGAAVLGAGAAAIYLGGQGGIDDGTLDPGRITLSP